MTDDEVAAAKQANEAQLSRTSLRTIQTLLGLRATGTFEREEAELIDGLSQSRSAPRGVIDEYVLDKLVRKAIKTPDMWAHAFYLVDDFFDTWLAERILTLRFDSRLTQASKRTAEGRLGIVTLGPKALADGLKSMKHAIDRLGAVRLVRSSQAPSHLSAAEAEAAAQANRLAFADLRSPEAIKDAIGARTNDGLGIETSQWVAAFQKRTRGLKATGIVDDDTLRAIVKRLVATGRPTATIRMLADRFGLDHGDALDVDYEATQSSPFVLDHRQGDAPVRITFGAALFKQPYEEIIHTIADAFAQARAHAGWLSPEYQEFFGKYRALTQDLPQPGFGAFEKAVQEALTLFGRLSEDERMRGVWSLKEVLKRWLERSRAEGRSSPALEDALMREIDAVRPEDALMRP